MAGFPPPEPPPPLSTTLPAPAAPTFELSSAARAFAASALICACFAASAAAASPAPASCASMRASKASACNASASAAALFAAASLPSHTGKSPAPETPAHQFSAGGSTALPEGVRATISSGVSRHSSSSSTIFAACRSGPISTISCRRSPRHVSHPATHVSQLQVSPAAGVTSHVPPSQNRNSDPACCHSPMPAPFNISVKTAETSAIRVS